MAIIALMAVVSLPALAFATTTEGSELEEPKILPLTDALKSDDDNKMKNVNEIWQEDVHEVVIRKQRGAKENGAGTTTGKKKERKDRNGSSTTTKVPKLDKNSDINSDTNTTQEPIGKKHQHHQSKHEKTNSKKHTSTIKPKPKDESNYQSNVFDFSILIRLRLTWGFLVSWRFLPLHEGGLERVWCKVQHPIEDVDFEEGRGIVRSDKNHPEEVQEG